jgi:hypothetical protein
MDDEFGECEVRLLASMRDTTSSSSVTTSLLIRYFSDIICFIERFRGDVDAVRPGESSGINEKVLEEFGVFQRLENRAAEPARNIDMLLCAVVESGRDDESTHSFCFCDLR